MVPLQVLRLIESFSLDDVRAAISEALERGVIGFDAVKHLVLCRIEKRPPRLNLLAHPYLPRAEVATTSARSYMGLLNHRARRAVQLRRHRHVGHLCLWHLGRREPQRHRGLG